MNSATFEKSKRLRDFLLYVGEHALREPGRQVTEIEIRRDVFGRSTDADALEETVVRVQASQLRRRLEQYFVTEGAAETLVIDVPRGGYTPMFRERPVPVRPPSVDASRPSPSRGPWPVIAAVLALACVWLAVDAWRSRGIAREHAPAAVLGPNVDRLWGQMFGGEPVYVVLSDSNLSLFQDTLRYQLTLPEYQRKEFVQMAEKRIPAAEVPVSWRLMNRDYTSIADARLVQRIARVRSVQNSAMDVVLARRVDPATLQVHNVVLAGPRRSNPWVELFEARLNFQSHFEEGTRRAWLQNMKPQAGEAAEYPVEWSKTGYGRVAYLGSPQGSNSVLLLSGIDLASTDACADFITSEAHVRSLLTTLGAGGGGVIPHFEVLLRTKLLLGTTSNYEVVAHRRLAP